MHHIKRGLDAGSYRAYFNPMVCPISQPAQVPLRRSSEPENVLGGVFSVTSGRRSYSPELGRWINRDPIGEVGGANLGQFCVNSPIEFCDHLGLVSKSCCDGYIGAITSKVAGFAAHFVHVPVDASEEDRQKLVDEGKCPVSLLCISSTDAGSKNTGDCQRLEGAGAKVRIMYDKHIGKNATYTLQKTFVHELQHALDGCERAKWMDDGGNCGKCLCKEVKARKCAYAGSTQGSLMVDSYFSCSKKCNDEWLPGKPIPQAVKDDFEKHCGSGAAKEDKWDNLEGCWNYTPATSPAPAK